MLYALDLLDGEKAQAIPGGIAICPACGRCVIAKCGSKKARHWAHRTGNTCDSWFEETAWHIAWKSVVREERCENIIKRRDEIHRADITGNRNTVIELQHSALSLEEIRERERFYDNMIWVVDAAGFFGNIIFKMKGEYTAIAWYNPRVAFLKAKKPVYFDLPCGNIFKLEYGYPKIHDHPLAGWGRFIGWKPFFHRYLSSVVKDEYKSGEQPEAIRDHGGLDLARLKFHHNMRIVSRCECGSSDEYPNCRLIMKSADRDYIRRRLILK